MRRYIINIVSFFLAGYLAFSSFILVKIITNDIILNSYKVYSSAKINGNAIVEKAENVYEKGKLWFNKLKNKEKAQEFEKQYQEQLEMSKKEQETMIKELEFNQKVLSGLPYIIAIIIFIISYVKVLNYIEELEKKFTKKNTKEG